MPRLPTIRTIPKKLWGLLLSDKSWLGTVTLICVVLIVLIAWADDQLLGTPFQGWLMHLLPLIAVAMYVYAAARVYRLARNLWRALPGEWRRIKDDFTGKARPLTPEMEAAEASAIRSTRGLHLAIGLAVLALAMPGNPMIVTLAFSVGLLGAFLLLGLNRPDGHEETRTIKIGRIVLRGIRVKVQPHEVGAQFFAMAMAVYISFAGDDAIAGCLAGFVCGYAVANNEWRSAAALWPDLKKEVKRIVSVSPPEKE